LVLLGIEEMKVTIRTWITLFVLLVFGVQAFGVQAQTDVAVSGYQLGSGDLVRIQVYGESDLSVDARVTETGMIAYPFLGQIQLLGKTLDQVQQAITRGLRGDYLVDPKVSVTILEYRQIFINGEVKSPGGFAYQPGLTVRKAISLAGGFTERASKNKISIIAEKLPNTQRAATLNTPVSPGDIITVEQSFF
jgi:polysaccharide export outer membrane protein